MHAAIECHRSHKVAAGRDADALPPAQAGPLHPRFAVVAAHVDEPVAVADHRDHDAARCRTVHVHVLIFLRLCRKCGAPVRRHKDSAAADYGHLILAIRGQRRAAKVSTDALHPSHTLIAAGIQSAVVHTCEHVLSVAGDARAPPFPHARRRCRGPRRPRVTRQVHVAVRICDDSLLASRRQIDPHPVSGPRNCRPHLAVVGAAPDFPTRLPRDY
jgi:hypothetical protein